MTLASLPGVGAHRMAGGIAPIHHRESCDLPAGHEEVSVGHADRAGDACRDEPVERQAARALHDAAEDVGVVAVDERFTGLCDEGQGTEPVHGRADRFVLVGGVPAEARGGSESGRAIARGDRGVGAVRDARRVCEQVEDRDPSPRRCERAAGVRARRHGGAREARQPARDGIGERDPPFLDEHHDRAARDRLGLRRDAEDRIGPHRLPCLAIPPPDGLLVHDDAVAHDEGDGTGDPLRVDALLQVRVEACEARRVESGAHGAFGERGALRAERRGDDDE